MCACRVAWRWVSRLRVLVVVFARTNRSVTKQMASFRELVVQQKSAVSAFRASKALRLARASQHSVSIHALASMTDAALAELVGSTARDPLEVMGRAALTIITLDSTQAACAWGPGGGCWGAHVRAQLNRGRGAESDTLC